MKFSLEVDLDQVAGDPLPELGRILRYWGANLKHYTIEPGTGETIRDSEHAAVGTWTISG